MIYVPRGTYTFRGEEKKAHRESYSSRLLRMFLERYVLKSYHQSIFFLNCYVYDGYEERYMCIPSDIPQRDLKRLLKNENYDFLYICLLILFLVLRGTFGNWN